MLSWRWHWFFVEQDWLCYRTLPVAEEDLTEIVASFIDRMRQLRRGELPAPQLETALRQARLDRLLSLDGTDAIADALLRCVHDPWNLHEELQPADLARVATEVYRIQRRVIGGEGPTDRTPQLTRFETIFRKRNHSPDE